jgi:hypothetical protein
MCYGIVNWVIFKRLTKTRKGDKMEIPSWTLDFSKVHVSIIKLIFKIMSALSPIFFEDGVDD